MNLSRIKQASFQRAVAWRRFTEACWRAAEFENKQIKCSQNKQTRDNLSSCGCQEQLDQVKC